MLFIDLGPPLKVKKIPTGDRVLIGTLDLWTFCGGLNARGHITYDRRLPCLLSLCLMDYLELFFLP